MNIWLLAGWLAGWLALAWCVMPENSQQNRTSEQRQSECTFSNECNTRESAEWQEKQE